uniref:Uncharacterized protein n=1 Tax=Oryza glumipatula TaxID=40148 RepID=A0A0D9YS75_9ORYZ
MGRRRPPPSPLPVAAKPTPPLPRGCGSPSSAAFSTTVVVSSTAAPCRDCILAPTPPPPSPRAYRRAGVAVTDHLQHRPRCLLHCHSLVKLRLFSNNLDNLGNLFSPTAVARRAPATKATASGAAAREDLEGCSAGGAEPLSPRWGRGRRSRQASGGPGVQAARARQHDWTLTRS